jgi:RNA polymerase sporulation-specific sigma factor
MQDDKTDYIKPVESDVDLEFVLSAQKGDKTNQDFLIAKYEGMVRRRAKAYYLIGADGEDIVQEGMIGLYKAIRDFRQNKQTTFKSFAELCVTRQIITAIKTATRQKHIPLNSYISLNKSSSGDESDQFVPGLVYGQSEHLDPETMVIGREDFEILESIIGEVLSDLERKVLSRYIVGKSYSDISAELEITAKSVDNAVQRIRRKLENSINRETR